MYLVVLASEGSICLRFTTRAHNCKYRFSLKIFKGAGQNHGEGIEQSWAESKQSGGSTCQMNHGHQHDKLND